MVSPERLPTKKQKKNYCGIFSSVTRVATSVSILLRGLSRPRRHSAGLGWPRALGFQHFDDAGLAAGGHHRPDDPLALALQPNHLQHKKEIKNMRK